MTSQLNGKRVLVTGASGFIGGRLVERLVVEAKADVRVLLRQYVRGLRVARFPVEVTCGDVTDADVVTQAMADCDVVFHCAYGNSGDDAIRREINVAGTANVLKAARRRGVKRVVHFSTVMVYGIVKDGVLDETRPRRRVGDPYADSKLEAEELALDYARRHDLPVVVLQPSVVYGPFATTWTTHVLRNLHATRQILVDGGQGVCNHVYVDDVVTAALMAAVRDNVSGEIFLVSGPDPVTWRDFYGRFEQMLGASSSVGMSVAQANSYRAGLARRQAWDRVVTSPEAIVLWRLIRRMLGARLRERVKRLRGAQAREDGVGAAALGRSPGEKLIRPLPPILVEMYAARSRISTEKARALLGYVPAFDFSRGMGLTEEWARWANLLPPR